MTRRYEKKLCNVLSVCARSRARDIARSARRSGRRRSRWKFRVDPQLLTSMRSWTRFEIPRLAMTKNLVMGPGTVSCTPSVFPATPDWFGGLLPLPATSWKDDRPFALVGEWPAVGEIHLRPQKPATFAPGNAACAAFRVARGEGGKYTNVLCIA